MPDETVRFGETETRSWQAIYTSAKRTGSSGVPVSSRLNNRAAIRVLGPGWGPASPRCYRRLAKRSERPGGRQLVLYLRPGPLLPLTLGPRAGPAGVQRPGARTGAQEEGDRQ